MLGVAAIGGAAVPGATETQEAAGGLSAAEVAISCLDDLGEAFGLRLEVADELAELMQSEAGAELAGLLSSQAVWIGRIKAALVLFKAFKRSRLGRGGEVTGAVVEPVGVVAAEEKAEGEQGDVA